jgi:hypothetical protein
MKIIAVWGIAPCSLIEVDRHFRGAYCLNHQGDERWGNDPLQNMYLHRAVQHRKALTNIHVLNGVKIHDVGVEVICVSSYSVGATVHSEPWPLPQLLSIRPDPVSFTSNSSAFTSV